MASTFQNLRLKELLEAEAALRDGGFETLCGPTGSVVITRRNHVRGLWHFAGGAFNWTPAGYGAPTYCAHSLADAVRYTVVSVLPKS